MIQTMRWIFIAAALIALPGQVQALSADDARHLLVRTGFAAPVDEVEAISGLSRAQAVSHILAKAGTEAGSAPPDFVGEPWVDRRTVRRMSADERQSFVRQRFREGRELKAWWYREMLETRTPVTEVMTLFWHSHFTSS
ncbi:MAG: DUF1800 family protein, partial [Alphaproteobacteria bacterium]|nr:DUF1800 family protein [Alphaproteobacteria bacterium]